MKQNKIEVATCYAACNPKNCWELRGIPLRQLDAQQHQNFLFRNYVMFAASSTLSTSLFGEALSLPEVFLWLFFNFIMRTVRSTRRRFTNLPTSAR